MTYGNSICPATNICFLPLHTITNSATSPYRGPKVKRTLEISWTTPYNRATHTNQVCDVLSQKIWTLHAG